MYKFCLTHKYNPQLENINYLNVGMGNNKFPNSWTLDSTGDNISSKKQVLRHVFLSLLALEELFR